MTTTATPPQPRDLNAKPWFSLAYLFFAYLPLLFSTNRPPEAVVATLLATACFLPMHFLFARDVPRYRLPLTLGVAALGCALLPFSTGGTTFTVYATAMAASRQPIRRAVWLTASFVTLIGLEHLALGLPPLFAITSIAMTAIVTTLVASTIIHARSRNLRDAELRLTQDEVKRLASMAERERIGRDLHDLLGHTLSVVVLKSELAGKLIARDQAAATTHINEVEQIARQALTQVREAVTGIRAVGLHAELASARLALLSADVHLDQRVQPVQLDEAVERVFAFVVREAVTNVLRHAAAHRVEVELTSDSLGVRLMIADDGRGGIDHPGQGLTGMRERVTALNGTLEIESPRGAGTRLSIRAPVLASVPT